MALQVTGFSNIDTSSIIDQLMSIERQPVVKLEFTKTLLNTRKQALLDINTKLLSVYTSANDLLSSTVWNSKASTSSNTSLLSVTNTSDAYPTTYQILVNTLAQAHSVRSDVQYDLSRWIEPSKAQRIAGDIQINGKTVGILETDTLYQIRDKINNAGADVTATIVDNALRIQRKTTGDTQLSLVDSITTITKTTSSDNEAIVTSAINGDPARGTYHFDVTQLAEFRVASDPTTVADPDAALGKTGSFSITVNGTPYTVDVAAGDSLNGIRDSINNNVPGVLALTSGTTLRIQSDSGADFTAAYTAGPNDVLQELGVLTGGTFQFVEANLDAQFLVNGVGYTKQSNVLTDVDSPITGLDITLDGTIGATDVRVIGNDGALRQLGVLDSDGLIKNQLIAAQNANIAVDGQTVIRSTNSISDAINGVTLVLKGITGATPVTVEVKTDVDTIKSKITAFVNVYNAAMDAIKAKLDEKRVINAKTDSDKLKGVLYNDSQLFRIKNRLRDYATQVVGELPNTMNNLSLIGIQTTAFTSGLSIDTSGKLNVDDTKLTAALQNNLSDVKELFIHNQYVLPFDSSKSGIAVRMKNYLSSITQYGGTLLSRQTSIQSEIDVVENNIDRWNARLTKIEANYKKQFSLMEQTMAMMQSQMNWLSTQFNNINQTSQYSYGGSGGSS